MHLDPSKHFAEISFFYGPDINGVPNHVSLLTEEEQEVLCELSDKDEFFTAKQKDIARHLLKTYPFKPNTSDNAKKVQRCKDILSPPEPKETLTLKQQFQELITWFSALTWDDFKEWFASFADPIAWAKSFRGWFDSFRLFFLRVNRTAILTGNASTAIPAFAWFVYLIKICGLSYFISIIAELVDITYQVFFRKRSIKEKYLPLWKCVWERFKSVMQEEDGKRIYNLLNDSGWVSINATGIFLTGGLLIPVNAAINVAGFGGDVLNETLTFRLPRYLRYARVENKITKIMTEQEIHLDLYDKPDNELPEGYIKLSEEDYIRLGNAHAKLQRIKDQVQAKKIEVRNEILYMAFCLTLVVVGMVLVFYPPTFLPGAAIIGAVLALTFGSLTTGLGRRLYNLTKESLLIPLYEGVKNLVKQAVEYFYSKIYKPIKNMDKLPKFELPEINIQENTGARATKHIKRHLSDAPKRSPSGENAYNPRILVPETLAPKTLAPKTLADITNIPSAFGDNLNVCDPINNSINNRINNSIKKRPREYQDRLTIPDSSNSLIRNREFRSKSV